MYSSVCFPALRQCNNSEVSVKSLDFGRLLIPLNLSLFSHIVHIFLSSFIALCLFDVPNILLIFRLEGTQLETVYFYMTPREVYL
jgi:hypothetical protein